MFDEIDKGLSTKDKQVILDKLDMLENMMNDFLHIYTEEYTFDSIEEFIAKALNMNIEKVSEEIDLYNGTLEELLENTVKFDSKLREVDNRPSLLAMMAFSYQEDEDLDEWMSDYASRNNTYFIDQKKNFLHMKQDFKQYSQKSA